MNTAYCNNDVAHTGYAAVDAILARTSVRVYDESKPVEDDKVGLLMHAAMAAPSAVDRRPWEFVVVRDRRLLDSLAEALPYAKMLGHAPLGIVCCGDSGRFLEGDDADLWVQDLAAASENILVAACAMGLGAVWTSVYPHADRQKAVREILGIPDGLIPFNVIPVGYPLHEHGPRPKWDPSRVHYDGWR